MRAGVHIVIVSCVYLTVASWATKIPRHWTHEAFHRCRVSSKEDGYHHSDNMGFDEQGQCADMKVPKPERTKYRNVSCMLLFVMMCCILQVYSSVRHEYMFLKHSDDNTDDGHCHACITSIRKSMEHQLCEHKDTIRIQERHTLERSHSNTDGHSQYGRQIKRTVEKYFDSLSGEIERVLSSLFQIQPQYLSVPELVAQPFTTSLTTYLGRVQMEGQVPVEEEMCHEIRRLQSFSGTPVQASPIRLAQSGFYATGREDEARCYSCRKSRIGWQIMDKPDVLHRVISPECPHLNRNEPRNIPLSSDSNGSTIYGILGEYSGSNNVTTTDTLPPTTIENGAAAAAAAAEAAPVVSASSLDMNSAVHPLYKDMQSRLDSFRDWDTSHTQDPHVLATAGFFYAGYSDCVRCFYCGVGLKTWEEGDDPWVEHVRWRSSCSYIRRLKGDNFVIQALTNEASPKPTVTNNTAVVARAVEMGYAQQMVERAVTEMSQSYNSPRAAGVTDQHPVQLEALIERLVIASQDTEISERHLMSYIPQERLPVPEVPEERHRMSEVPKLEHQEFEVPQSLPSRLAPLSDSATARHLRSVKTPTLSSLRHPREYTQDRSTSGTESSRSMPPSLQRQIKEENRALRDENTCKVCLDRSSCVVFLPCGHLVTCAECAPALRKCPICRSLIRGTLRTYNA